MTYVVDTHALVWFLSADERLSDNARAALSSKTDLVVVSTMVLAEIAHAFRRGRIVVNLDDAISFAHQSSNVRIRPVDETVVGLLPPGLELHDAIIVATALALGAASETGVALITVDKAITSSGLVTTLW